MTTYRFPLRDLRHLFTHVVDFAAFGPWFDGLDLATAMGILEESARFTEDRMIPTNIPGDQVGSQRNDDGSVTAAPGFRELHQGLVDAGWFAVKFDPAYGGGGMPATVGTAIQEMHTAANMGYSVCTMLSQGAIEMLQEHGSEEMKEVYLPKMISGEWTGTMNLTESDAGSDVGALRTKAEPVGDGTYRLTGNKIFISFGEHDMTENIIHMVLARTPGAPPGTKGISCFVVPKFLVNDDGSLGDRNDVTCASIEHKMGIHGSPTCVMAYGDNDGAVGYLIGEENQGMRYMFTMMNQARLSVGVQGLGIADRAHQAALEYATERVQGRVLGAEPGSTSAIVEHADVRRMLLYMRSHIDALRALIYLNSASIDLAEHHPDEAARAQAAGRAELLTPLSKAWGTDLGVEVSSVALQVFGGMGYVEETGIAQHYRDARIAPIYEGTNGIQAIDLVMRKLPLDGGGVVKSLFADLDVIVEQLADAQGSLAEMAGPLRVAIDATNEAIAWIDATRSSNPNDVLAGATPFLRMLAMTVSGCLLAKSALGANADLAGGDDPFLEAKIASAHFFATQYAPQAAGLLPSVTAGAAPLYAIDPEHLGV